MAKLDGIQRADFRQNWREVNTGRLFYEGFVFYNVALLKSLDQSEFSGIRNTHLNLLRHLDASGTRMSDLASRSNLTKAAITSLVKACQALDLVTVEQCADDARARMVRFSPKGLDLMHHIQETILTLERLLLARLGQQQYCDLRSALLLLSSLRDKL